MRLKRNYYEVMGLSRASTSKDIKLKYHELARQFHPDRSKDKELAQRLFSQINLAYGTLSDESKRAMYDASLDSEAAAVARANAQHSGPAAYVAPRPTQSGAPPLRPTPTAPLHSTVSAARPASQLQAGARSQATDHSARPTASHGAKPAAHGSRPTTQPVGRPRTAQSAGGSKPQGEPTIADVTKLIDRANIEFFRGDREAAIKLCQQVLKVDSTNYDAHRITGDIYADQGRRTEAIAAYLEALRVQPNNRQLHDKLRLLQAPPVATPTTRPTGGSATVPLGNGTSGKSQERPSLFRRFIGGSK